MGELTSGILSGAAWDAIKKGINISKIFLKNKLSNWLLDDESLDKIVTYLNDTPNVCLQSEGMLKEYINLNEDILNCLKNAIPKSIEHSFNQHIESSQGLAINTMIGGNVKNSYKNKIINNYSSGEEPRKTQGLTFSLMQRFNKYHAVQVVKSFSSTRDNYNVVNNDTSFVHVNINIPKDVCKKDSCQFAMLLFLYVPSENLLNYYDEQYRLEFILNTSQNIKKVQLQIKDTQQSQFVDLPLNSGEFKVPLNEISIRTSWKDVREICFTVFADENYIVGENGFIEVNNLQLTKA